LYHMGRAQIELKQYDKAIDKLRSSVKVSAARDPDMYPGRLCTLWQCHQLKNDWAAADKVAAQFQSTLFISKPYWAFETAQTISASYANRGQPEKARALMTEYLKRSRERYNLDSNDTASIADMERRLGAMSN
jgi:hypothetical protein